VDWQAVEKDSAQTALAKALVDLVPDAGWNLGAMEEASHQVFGDKSRWRQVFPRGPIEAIWFISEVSDASMLAAFVDQPASGMASVIDIRFAQNRSLKAFVRRVMQFDMAHPFQALSRMQRTARVMFDCLAPDRRRSNAISSATLNIAYTIVVFVWLLDRSPDGGLTAAATAIAMKLLRL
jgi:hypothetical protein